MRGPKPVEETSAGASRYYVLLVHIDHCSWAHHHRAWCTGVQRTHTHTLHLLRGHISDIAKERHVQGIVLLQKGDGRLTRAPCAGTTKLPVVSEKDTRVADHGFPCFPSTSAIVPRSPQLARCKPPWPRGRLPLRPWTQPPKRCAGCWPPAMCLVHR